MDIKFFIKVNIRMGWIDDVFASKYNGEIDPPDRFNDNWSKGGIYG
jgi:hypothetical protein